MTDHDITCYGCGYNLAALPDDGDCPECGMSIAHTHAASTLELADVQWLERIRGGLAWLIVAFALAVLSLVLLLIPSVYMSIGSAFYVIMFARLAVIAVATIRLTVGDPAIVSPTGARPERWARILLLTFVAVLATWYLWWPVVLRRAATGVSFSVLLWGGLFVAGMTCLLVHIRRIAERTSDHALSRRLRRLTWAFFIFSAGRVALDLSINWWFIYGLWSVVNWTVTIGLILVNVGLIRAMIGVREALNPIIERIRILDAAAVMPDP